MYVKGEGSGGCFESVILNDFSVFWFFVEKNPCCLSSIFFFFSSRVVLKIWAVVGLDINRRLWYSVCTGQLVVPILKPVPVRRSSLPVILSCRVYFFYL